VYHFLVKRRVRWLFAEANRGNFQAIVDSLAERFVYRFVGDTPLGGVRTKKSSVVAWFQRIYRLVPDATLNPHVIVVEGPPWNTRIMTYITFNGTVPATDGQSSAYENDVMQLMHLKWGRIHSVLTVEDTQRFSAVLPRLSQAGIVDATAAPISDVVM
jgi:ketosteroid isomerase-like protein